MNSRYGRGGGVVWFHIRFCIILKRSLWGIMVGGMVSTVEIMGMVPVNDRVWERMRMRMPDGVWEERSRINKH